MGNEKKYGKFALSLEQTRWLKRKYEDKYGGFGAFVGMVSNQSIEFSKDFGECLHENIDRIMELEKTFVELSTETEKPNDDMPRF